MSIDSDVPFEGMDQMIGFVVDEAYRLFADTSRGTKRPKRYIEGVAPAVDAAIRKYGIVLEPDAWWWEVVDALCAREEWRLAELAQRHAVPLLQDLITAAVGLVMNFGAVPYSEESALDFVDEVGACRYSVYAGGEWRETGWRDRREFDFGPGFGKRKCMPLSTKS